MAVLFAGGEDICFPNRDQILTSTAYRRPDYARHSLWILNYLETPAVTPQDDVWVTVQWGWHVHHFLYDWVDMFQLRDAAGAIVASLQFSSGNMMLRAFCKGQAGESWFVSPQALRKLDIHYKRHPTLGEFAVYTDNQLRSKVAGDTDNGQVSKLRVVATMPATYGPQISEVCIATDDTRTFDVVTLTPNAAGDLHQWIDEYTAVDDEELNTTDCQTTTTTGQEELLNLSNLPAAVPETAGVRAVHVWRYAAKDADGPTGFYEGLKTNGTIVYRGAPEVLDTGWASKDDLYLVNPVTGLRFTKAEIDALQTAKKTA